VTQFESNISGPSDLSSTDAAAALDSLLYSLAHEPGPEPGTHSPSPPTSGFDWEFFAASEGGGVELSHEQRSVAAIAQALYKSRGVEDLSDEDDCERADSDVEEDVVDEPLCTGMVITTHPGSNILTHTQVGISLTLRLLKSLEKDSTRAKTLKFQGSGSHGPII
jgi:hypothetical protein